jgi:FRG domain
MKTLTEVYRTLSQRYRRGQMVMVQGHDYAQPARQITLLAPSVVFRGEPDASWGSMESSMQRLWKNDELCEPQKREIESLCKDLDAHCQKFFKFHPALSAGLLQHYGLCSEVLDVSPSLNVAAYFAAYDNKVGTGSITIMQTDSLATNAMLFDLTPLEFAKRPVSQEGYAIFHRHHTDLRAPAFAKVVKWARKTFTVTDQDYKCFVQCQPQLHEPYTDEYDPGRAIIQHQIDCYCRARPLSGGAAAWLSQRIPPTLLTVIGGTFEPRITIDLGPHPNGPQPFVDATMRSRNAARWCAPSTGHVPQPL